MECSHRAPLGDKTGNINLVSQCCDRGVIPDCDTGFKPKSPITTTAVTKLRRRAALRISPRKTQQNSTASRNDAKRQARAFADPACIALGPIPALDNLPPSFHVSCARPQSTHSNDVRRGHASPMTDANVSTFQAIARCSESSLVLSPSLLGSSRRSSQSNAPRSLMRVSRHPYEPWTASVRRRILPPPLAITSCAVLAANRNRASIASVASRYSRPYSRSGACAPEPVLVDFNLAHNRHRPRFVHIPNSYGRLSGFGGIVKHSISRMANRFRGLKLKINAARRSSVLPSSPLTALTFGSDDVPSEFRISMLPSPRTPPSHRTSGSELWADSFSTRSAGSSALEMWLESRRRSLLQYEEGGSRASMTLEEYERRGSWITTAQPAHGQSGTQWLCGVMECGTHEHKTASPPAHWVS
jgi:hypothetical protein